VLDPENKATIRPVRTGEWIGQDWLILEGLKPGDRVVLDNLLKLRPGAPVNPQVADARSDAAKAPAPDTAKAQAPNTGNAAQKAPPPQGAPAAK
jgi:membrane fusion protein (multidrug efflux system)